MALQAQVFRLPASLAWLIAFFLIFLSNVTAIKAETLDWATRPATNLLTANDVATVNGVTMTTSATTAGTFTATSVLLQPAGTSNGTTGFINSTMNASTDDEAARQIITITFSEPVYNVTFTVWDLDGGPAFNDGTNFFNDVVTFTSSAGVPTSGTPASQVTWTPATGRAQATANAGLANANGNITVTFAGPVTSLTINHIAGAVTGSNNPTNQAIFVEDISFQRAPRLAVQKSSTGGTGSTTFNFNVSNSGTGTTATSVATSGAAVTGTAIRLNATSTATTITETGPAGWQISPASSTCTDANSANSGNPASFAASVSGLVVTVPAVNIRPGAELTCAITNARLPTVTLTKISNGGTGGFTFTGTNGWASQTITTVTAGTGVTGATQTLTAVSTATTITETIPAGWQLVSVTCTGTGGGTQPTVNTTTGAIDFTAAQTAPGSAIACTVTNARRPTVTITKVSNGGVGAFNFDGTNGFGATQTITTVTSGAGVAGATRTLAAASTSTTIVETIPSGYTLASISCAGLGAGGTATPNLSAGLVTLDAAATAPGSNIACTFTNARRPTVTLTKVSNGGIGGFTFTGTNGWASQTITTVTAGTGVTGATQTLTAVSTATTITETIPAGWQLVSVTCTGTGGGTQPTVNTATGAIDFTAAQTAPGSAIACTVTNARRPTVTLTKISNGGTGGFTFTGTNGWASQTITTVTAGTGVAGATQTLTAVSTATTITETIPAGWQLVSVTCTGTGGGTQPTVNTTTGAIDFTAAQTAPGSNIACTVTNGLIAYTVAKSASTANISAPGTITYTMTVTNTGGALLTGTTFSDSLAQGVTPKTLTTGPSFVSGDTANSGVFDPGEVWIYTATYNATQAEIDDGGTFANIFTFDTAQSSPQVSNTALTTVTRTPNLSVLKQVQTGTPTPLVAGQTITFEYLVTNTGNVTLSGVGIQETAFNGTGGTGALTPAGGAAALAPGASTTFTANYTVTQNDVDTLQ